MSDPPASAIPSTATARPGKVRNFMPALLLILGLLIGIGGTVTYQWIMPSQPPQMRTLVTRFVLPIPLGTCKQVMVLGFHTAGFQNVIPDAGEDVGVGAPGDRISGAAMCMPALGAAAVALSSADNTLLNARMQAFANAVAATNMVPQAPAQRR